MCYSRLLQNFQNGPIQQGLSFRRVFFDQPSYLGQPSGVLSLVQPMIFGALVKGSANLSMNDCSSEVRLFL